MTKDETPATAMTKDETPATEVAKAAESAARKAVDQFFTRSERRSRRRRLAALAVVSSAMPILTFLGLDDISDIVWRRVVEDNSSISEMQQNARVVAESAADARNAAAAIKGIQDTAESVLRDLQGRATSALADLEADLEADSGLVQHSYTIDVPVEEGTSRWETNMSTDMYRLAIVGGWYIYSSEGRESASSCNYHNVVEVFMDRSDPTWRLIVNKMPGCDRLRVDVAYVPAAWVGAVSVPGEARLERTPGR